MKVSSHRQYQRVLFFFFLVSFVFVAGYVSTNPRAQEKPQLPSRASYVNDFAGIVEEKTKQRLEALLENVKQKVGIELDVVTVQTTGSQDIFDFSRQLAGTWDVGARNSVKKSLLLVVSVNEKSVFTQFSKSVQPELPEGILGELSQRLRWSINAGQFNQGLSDGVDHFVAALAKRFSLSVKDLDPTHLTAVANTPSTIPESSPTPTAPPETVPEAPKPSPETAASPATTTASATTTVRVPDTSGSRPRKVTATPITTAAPTTATTTEDDEAESEEVELTLTLPLVERIAKLKQFLAENPKSKSKQRAAELLISSYAGLGDQLLKNGDVKGIEQLLMAVNEAPVDASEKLFSGVISQVPLNLFVRGHRDEAFKAAKVIEAKFGSDPKRLVAIAGFYLGVEEGAEAARIAEQAVKLAPDLADAHFMLGRSFHITFRLDEAAAEYKRANELDPTSRKGARRSLADLYRAAGKAEEGLALYREQLAAEPTDKAARAGLVISLLDLGRTDEANNELANALQEDPRNLLLLSGAAYWFAAHNESERALELARKAVEIEPRYTWSQVALARALVAQKKPLEAEGPVRFARQYGRFPTLDYELASVLAASGLYGEAAEVLAQSFSVKDGQLETRLAGRLPAREADFIKLLAPERRASIFQFASPDDANNPAMLKALLVFTLAIQPQENKLPDEAGAAAAAKEFTAGSDDMRAFRQLYAASQLVRNNLALQAAYDLAEAAKTNVDAAISVSSVTVATQADELRDYRAQAIAQGAPPVIPEAPRNVLANILRARIEDVAGWALYNQDKTAEAIERLQRAVSIAPENTPAWRDSLWHLGAALDQSGKKQEALTYYIKSYNAGEPDAGRRTVIEQVYQKANGSLDGLDERIGPKIVAANASAPSNVTTTPLETPSSVTPQAQVAASTELAPTPVPTGSPMTEAAAPSASPASAPTPESSPAPTVTEPATAASPAPSDAAASPQASPQPTRAPDSTDSFIEMAGKLKAAIKISGKVKDANNSGVANVVVVLISPKGSVLATTTDSEGNYSFIVAPSPQSYRLIPSKDGYTFAPIDRVLAGFTDDQKGVDFVAATTRSP